MALIRVNVNAPDDKITEFSSGAKLYWARDNTSATGSFTDASGSTALVATQSQYEIVDNTGAEGHYYRTRVGNSGGTLFEPWSAVFQLGAPIAYANFDDLREMLNLPDASQDNVLADLLADASGWIDAECGRDFYRHPGVTGTEIRTFNGNGSSWLPVAAGIVSLTTVEVAQTTGASYTTVASTGWFLEPRDKASDLSYSAVALSDFGPQFYWPPGYATVRLTGVFGSATIPPLIKKAALDLAREAFRQGPGGGGPVGINQFGTPIFGGGMPASVTRAIARYGPVLVG